MAARTIQQFDADLREFSKQLKIKLDVVIRKTILDVWAAAVAISPVDTGRFSASWMIEQGKIPNNDGLPPGNYRGPKTPDVPTKDVTMAPWYIYNNVEYAEALENGHSQQAPAGILDIALAEVEASIAVHLKHEL